VSRTESLKVLTEKDGCEWKFKRTESNCDIFGSI